MNNGRLIGYCMFALFILVGVGIAIWPGVGQALSYPGWRPTRRAMRVGTILWLALVVTMFITFIVQDQSHSAGQP